MCILFLQTFLVLYSRTDSVLSFFQCFTRLQTGRVIMTDSSDGESVGSDCGHIGGDHRPACNDFFFLWLQFALQRQSV